MNQEKILLQIETGLADLKSFMRKIKPEAKLHQIDIDLIKQKVRNIYDAASMLEADLQAELKATVSDIKKPEIVHPDEGYDDSFQKEKHWNETKENVLRAEDLVTEPHDEEIESATIENIQEVKPEEKEPKEEKEVENLKVEEEVQEINAEENDLPNQPDLFSTSETIADKLTEKSKPTLADKLIKKSLSSLKELIGINEKFLFINELFKGDMRNYSNALEELDNLETFEGANTYLFELKIQNQWSDDLDAYLKLKELIEKKFKE